MNTVHNNGVESRRGFLKKSVYIAPALIALGQLSANATYGSYSNGGNSCDSNSHGGGSHSGVKGCASKLNANNGWGNGDQCAPGNSGSHNNAENHHDSKDKVNHVGVDTHGGHEKDLAEDKHKTSSRAPFIEYKKS